jgi:excinuclease UvrABC helicase subunit UvrB
MEDINIYPAKHFVTPKDRLDDAIKAIRTELRDRLEFLNGEGKLLEAQRLEQRTKYDLGDARPGGLLPRRGELRPAFGGSRGGHTARMLD